MCKHWLTTNQSTHEQILIIHQPKYTWPNIGYPPAKVHMSKHWLSMSQIEYTWPNIDISPCRLHKTNIYYPSTISGIMILHWLPTNKSTHDLTLINHHIHQTWININEQPTRAHMTNWWKSRNCHNNLIGILFDAIFIVKMAWTLCGITLF